MDDLIVIILTIIIAGVGVLGQLKKKKLAAADSGQPKQSENFWDLLEGEDEILDQREDPDFVEVKRAQLVKDVNVSSSRDKAKKEASSNLNYGLTKKSLKLKKKQKTIKAFSLRKAVIYSEILNRKYT